MVGLFSARRAVATETIVVDYAVSESVLWRCPLMFSVVRSRKLAAFLLVIATCLAVSIEAQAELFPGLHKQNVVLVPGGVVMAPTFASAPVAVVGSAPVMVGAISTTSANYYTMPATGAAPTPTYFYTSGGATTAAAPTITTAAAPTVITASAPTTAAAPTANVVMIGATGNAPTGAAPTVTTSLTQDELSEIVVALREQNDQLKSDKTAASERRSQLLEKAKELIAEKKAVEVDDLEAADKQLARYLVSLAMKAPANGTTNGAVWGGTQVLGAAPVAAGTVYAAAPAASQVLYPVQLVPVYFRPACNHHFWCNCPKTYP